MDGEGIVVNAGKTKCTWRRRDSIFIAVPGNTEQFMSRGKNATIAATTSKTALAWNKDGRIFYKLDNGPEKPVGRGKSQVLQMVGDKKIICVWDDNGIIRYSLFDI